MGRRSNPSGDQYPKKKPPPPERSVKDSMNPYPQVVHTFTIYIIVLVLFALFIPFTASAAVLYEQTDSSVTSSYSSGGDIFFQSLGTGLTGTAEYIEVYASYNVTGSPQGTIVGCNTNVFNGACDVGQSFSSTQVNFPSANYTAEGTMTGTLASPLTFNSAKYYFFDTTNFSTYPISYRGSSTSLYAGGDCAKRGGGACGTVVDIYFRIADSGGVYPDSACLSGDLGSCINSVDPVDGQQIATSSLPYDFQLDGFISGDDYEEGARVVIKVDRNTDQQAVGALLAFNSAFGNKTFIPLDGSGSFDVSTSSDNLRIDFPLRTGLYRARWEIQSPAFSLFGFEFGYNTLVSSSTRFTVSTTTAIDNIQLAQENYLNDIINTLEGDPLASCQFSWFESAIDFSLGSNLMSCMGGLLHWLFVLPEGVMDSTITQLKEGFLTRVPWGYFTRIVTAVSGGASSTLPTLHADVPYSATEDISIEFDLDDIVTGAAAIQDDFQAPNGNTAREIIEPIIQTIVGLLVLMFIYKDVLRQIHR